MRFRVLGLAAIAALHSVMNVTWLVTVGRAEQERIACSAEFPRTVERHLSGDQTAETHSFQTTNKKGDCDA